MNILFLADNFAPERNAQASRVYERACYWVRWGHQVTVLTCWQRSDQNPAQQGSIVTFFVSGAGLLTPRCARRSPLIHQP
jgi:hypothetical protein